MLSWRAVRENLTLLGRGVDTWPATGDPPIPDNIGHWPAEREPRA
jgi:hypothetical protein